MSGLKGEHEREDSTSSLSVVARVEPLESGLKGEGFIPPLLVVARVEPLKSRFPVVRSH